MWSGAKDKNGYGFLNTTKTPNRPRWSYGHRLSWEIHFGPIPIGLQVCHKCDTPGCVNPQHFFLGTQSDNTLDAAAKGRMKGRKGALNNSSKLNDSKVLEIRRLFSNGERRYDLADKFGVSHTNICEIVNGNSWKHLLQKPTLSDIV